MAIRWTKEESFYGNDTILDGIVSNVRMYGVKTHSVKKNLLRIHLALNLYISF